MQTRIFELSIYSGMVLVLYILTWWGQIKRKMTHRTKKETKMKRILTWWGQILRKMIQGSRNTRENNNKWTRRKQGNTMLCKKNKWRSKELNWQVDNRERMNSEPIKYVYAECWTNQPLLENQSAEGLSGMSRRCHLVMCFYTERINVYQLTLL